MKKDRESIRAQWLLREDIVYLNHGSFGACPREILEYQKTLREELEAQPVDFLVRQFEDLLCAARDSLASFVSAQAEDLVFVKNASEAVNTVLRSLDFSEGDELLVTDHTYAACHNAVDFVASRSGAQVVVVKLPFPLDDEEEVIRAVLGAVTPKTRFALIDHITSPTALVLPVKQLVDALQERGVMTMVDGAHAVGMVDLDLDSLNASYYTSNCHKWLCAPKGSAFLHVRRDLQAQIRPLSISHAASMAADDPKRFQAEFAWPGTYDPTAYLVVPKCIQFLGGLIENGWPSFRERNRKLAVEARRYLLDAMGGPLPCPESMLGAMAAIILPNGDAKKLQLSLVENYGVEVVVSPWPEEQSRLLRVSLQAYNSFEDIEVLVKALVESKTI